MSNNSIRYRSGYKYQLASDYSIKTTLLPWPKVWLSSKFKDDETALIELMKIINN